MSRRVALVLEGSRGDQQPCIVAALALKEAGYDTLILCTSDGEGMAKQHGLAFRNMGMSAKEVTQHPDVVKAVTENDYAKIQSAVQELKAPHQKGILEKVVKELRSFKPGLIISSGMNLTHCLSAGKGLKIPVIFLSLQVMIPSNYCPALGLLPRLPSFLNMNWFAWKLVMTYLIKKGREGFLPIFSEQLGVPEKELQVDYHEFCDHCSCQAKFPILFAVSEAFHGKLPPDFNGMCRPLGPLMFRPDQQVGEDFGTPDAQRLQVFLQKCKASNEAPIYMGFGSMTCESSKFMTLLCLRALKSCGRAAVILSGWANLSLKDLEGETDTAELQAFCKDKVIFLDTAPHGQLFPQCAVIVHHGGAGTTYSAAVSGVPSVVVPILMDQYLHSDLVNQRGIGVGLKSMRAASVVDLSNAIRTCLESQEIRQKAMALSQQLAKEDGAKEVVKQVNEFFTDFVDTGRYFQEKKQSLEDSNRGCFSWLAGLCSFCWARDKGSL